MPTIGIKGYALQYILDKLVEEARRAGKLEAQVDQADDKIGKLNDALEGVAKKYHEMKQKLEQANEG